MQMCVNIYIRYIYMCSYYNIQSIVAELSNHWNGKKLVGEEGGLFWGYVRYHRGFMMTAAIIIQNSLFSSALYWFSILPVSLPKSGEVMKWGQCDCFPKAFPLGCELEMNPNQ